MGTNAQTNARSSSQLRSEILARMRGPGGAYNLGNLIGLVSGTAIQIAHGRASAAQTVADFFIGSPIALWLTLATLVFMISGECYYQDWKNGFPPDKALNRWGDFLSGIGALMLGCALFLLGQPQLAATAGLLQAFGKFGSAIYLQRQDLHLDWPKIFRWIVVFSRMPALGATVISLIHAVIVGSLERAGAPATLIVCLVVWLRADLMFLKE